MDIVFLNPSLPSGQIFMKELGRCGRRSIGGETWPQTGLASLAAVAQDAGASVRILDAMVEQLTQPETLNVLRQWQPDLVVAGTTTPTFFSDADFLRQVKEQLGTTTAMAGTHVSVMPERSMRESDVDMMLVGEAERTVQRLVTTCREAWAQIPGLALRRSEEVLLTGPAEVTRDLDTLPFPARHLLPWEKYHTPFSGKAPFATVIPSRGCPYHCTFCRAGSVWGHQPRLRSVSHVMAELQAMHNELPIRHFAFMTDTFTMQRDWVLDLMEEMKSLDYQWVCNSRVDTIDETMAAAMKAAGCQIVSFGVESANPEILKRVRKGINLDQARAGVRIAKAAGLTTFAYFILGLPGETPATAQETIEFAIRLDPDYANFHVAIPFPGTELYHEAQKAGWLAHEDWDQFEEMGSAVMDLPDFSREQARYFQQRATRQFYLRPRQLWRELKRIRSTSDLLTRLKACTRLFNVVKSSG